MKEGSKTQCHYVRTLFNIFRNCLKASLNPNLDRLRSGEVDEQDTLGYSVPKQLIAPGFLWKG